MTTIELALYKGKSTKTIKNRIFTALIKFWTRSKYSHAELVVKPTDNPNTWEWHSSENGIGVRIKSINYTPTHWDFIELDSNPYNIMECFHFIEKQVGKKYDWLGIVLSQVAKLNIENSNKWFCSELCFEALRKGGFFYDKYTTTKASNVSPERLRKMVINCV